MDMVTIILILLAVIVLPILLFFGLIGLGLFVWSWRRIGPYFVDFGRWIGNWRNYVPCGCLLFGGIVLLLLVAAILPQQFDILRIILLVLISIILAVCSVFAVIIWSVRLGRWLWSRFRKGFWEYLERLWNMLAKGVAGEGTVKVRRPAKGRQPPAKAGAEPTIGVGALTVGPKPAARVTPPARRSWLDLSWLWASVWGKPRKAARSPKLIAKSAEGQVQPATAAGPTTPPRVPTKPKAGLRPLMWRLGLLGKPRQPGGKPKPAATKGIVESPGKPLGPVPPMVSQPRPSVTAPAEEAAQAKQKPTVVLGPKPKRSALGPIGRLGRSIGGALEGLRKGFWAGAFWVGRKSRGGVDSILRLLHLGGKRR
jgi:hypothetical protein